MMPVLTSRIWDQAADHPSMLVFAVAANGFLALLTFTPLLLHFLTKRFAFNMYYNPRSQVPSIVMRTFPTAYLTSANTTTRSRPSPPSTTASS